MKKISSNHLLFLVLGILGLAFLAMPAFAQDATKMLELQRVIDAQQKQMEAQQKQLDTQRQLLQDLQKQMKSLVKDADTQEVPVAAEKPAAKPEVASTKAPPPAEGRYLGGGGERAKLSLSGWVNRMVNIVDDGKNTDAYFVDNDDAESRINLVGTVTATDDLTIGSRIELTIAPNKSGNVSQKNQEVNNIFDQRWVEASLASKRFGKLSLGKGDTASMNTAAADLSQTGIIAYATITDVAGGMLFREKNDDNLTDVSIFDAFHNFDGLNRKNRLRYDTPTYHGFSLAASVISDERYDGALRWGGQGYGFKAIGAAAFAYPNEDDTDFQYDGSFSLLHEDTGLNLTLSAGLLERDNQSDPYNYYGKVGWLTRFFSFGKTAFSADYARSVNLPTDSDDGYSIGAAAVQQFEAYGTEIYLLYRLHSLNRDVGPEVHDINVVSVGTRIKF
jgi:hypothetical protein